jgi:hypothetical protein
MNKATGFRCQQTDTSDWKQGRAPINFSQFEYRISNPPQAEMMKFSFPSTFIIPCSVFYGSLFSDT